MQLDRRELASLLGLAAGQSGRAARSFNEALRRNHGGEAGPAAAHGEPGGAGAPAGKLTIVKAVYRLATGEVGRL